MGADYTKPPFEGQAGASVRDAIVHGVPIEKVNMVFAND